MKNAIVLIDFIGCPRNVLLKLRFEDYLKANHWEIVLADDIDKADLVLFCSCGYTKSEELRSLELIRNVAFVISHSKTRPTFIVSGCLPKTNAETLRQIHNGYAIGPLESERTDAIIGAEIGISQIPLRKEIKDHERTTVVVENELKRVKLKQYRKKIEKLNRIKQRWCRIFESIIPYERFGQDWQGGDFDNYQMGKGIWSVTTSTGCMCNCSYCVIKLAKGKVKSRNREEIIAEIMAGVGKGYRNIALIGDDNGSYGIDQNSSFADLLLSIHSLTGAINILIDSLSPKDFIVLAEKCPEVLYSGMINRICLTIQHVSSGVLSKMNRSYDLGKLKKSIEDFYKKVPELVIDSHFIIGFPGETIEDYEQLAEFENWLIRLNPFNSIKNFPFTRHEGTAANILPEQNTPDFINMQTVKMEEVVLRTRNEIYMQHNNTFIRRKLYAFIKNRLTVIDKEKKALAEKLWMLERF